MPQIFITCPETQKPVYVGLNLDWNALESLGPEEHSFPCRECGQTHTWTKDDAFPRADGGTG